jgi:PAS domain S-box-containing protein
MTARPERATSGARPEEALEQALRELAEAHAELARRQSFTDALLETVEVGIVSCDAQGRFVVSNRAERTMFGLETGLDGLLPEHLPALIDVLTPDGQALGADDYPLMRTLRGETVSSYDVLVGPVGFPHREVVVRGSQILGVDGELLGAVAALTDVTAERTASRALAEERRKLTEAQRLGRLGSFEHDFRTGSWTFSDPLCELWGLAPAEMTIDRVHGLVFEEDRELVTSAWRDAAQGGGSSSYVYRIRRADDGAERTIRTRVEVSLDADGRPEHGRGTDLDITDLVVAERVTQRANAFFHAVLTATPDYTQVTDVSTGAIIYGSPGKEVLGRPGTELQALGPEALETLTHPDDQQPVRDLTAAATALPDGESLQLRYRARHVDGRWRWLNQSITPFRRDDAGTVVEVLAVLRDVTDLVEAEERLTYAAKHDVLTGLPNRTLLVDTLDAALLRSAREGGEVAVLFCDLDGFKHVNDTGGHSAGDAVLCETAGRIRSVLRSEDTVARVGGDEFVIVVEPWNRSDTWRVDAERPGGDSDRALALQVARRVTEALQAPIWVKGVEHTVTASVGITYASLGSAGLARDLTAEDVLHEADAAMYVAKDRGKNRFELFEPAREPHIPLSRRSAEQLGQR